MGPRDEAHTIRYSLPWCAMKERQRRRLEEQERRSRPEPPKDEIHTDFLTAEIAKGIPCIDLHGLSVKDAWEQTQIFLQEQYVKDVPVVRIIHGKGLGRLEQMLKQRLPTLTSVKEIRAATKPSDIGAVLLVRLN